LLAERGYAGTSVQEVAARAGCATGSVYNHFESKEDLLVGLLERWRRVEAAKVGLGTAGGSDIGAFLRAWLRLRTDAVEDNEPLLRALLSEMLVRPELRARYREVGLGPALAAGASYLGRIAERGEASVEDPEMLVRLLMAGMLGLGLLRLLGDPVTGERWSEAREALGDLVLEGIGAAGRR